MDMFCKVKIKMKNSSSLALFIQNLLPEDKTFSPLIMSAICPRV